MPEFYVHNGYELGSIYRYPDFPRTIGLDNHDSISALRWAQATPTGITATGTLNVLNCTPDCPSGTYVTYPVELIVSDPQHCTVNVYQPYSDQFKAEEAYVYNTIYAKALSGNPPSHFVGNAQALPPACEGPPSGTGSSPTGSSSPSSAGSATPPTQSCPTSAELLTVWDAASPALRQSWAAPSMTITGFAAIGCWSSWVVATPMSSSPGNGTFVFSQQGTLHLIPVAQMQAFRNAVCASPDSPIAWRNETLGGCSS
jgi:hypothetical protein